VPPIALPEAEERCEGDESGEMYSLRDNSAIAPVAAVDMWAVWPEGGSRCLASAQEPLTRPADDFDMAALG
jgi:hypothetical protein